jgi:hypothetical protein
MITPSTNKLLILNSILLVLILSILIILNFNKLKNKIVKNSEENYETIYEDYTDIKYYPKQDSLKVNLEGLKNDTIQLPGELIEQMAAELERFNWNDEFQERDLDTMYHETIFAKKTPSTNPSTNKFIVIVFSNYRGNHSHVSYGKLSLFECEKMHQNWQMTRKYLAFGYGTEYGLEPNWCKLVQIGRDSKYAVLVQTNYSGNGGHELETQSIYSEVGCLFELVFDFRNYEHYEDYPQEIEYTEGYSDLRFLKSNKAWFDIETKSEDTEWNDKTPGAVKRFVFNGKEYAEVK